MGKLVSNGIVEMALDFIAGLLYPETRDKMQTEDKIIKVMVGFGVIAHWASRARLPACRW